MATNFKIEVERFKPLPSNPSYLISDKGRVYSKKRKRFLLCSKKNRGYKMIGVYDNGKEKTRPVHQLVMEAFVGPRPDNYQVNHIDGNKINNSADNLEYCTPSQNQKHAYRMGLQKRQNGETHGKCKLTDLQIREIREKINSGAFLQRELAKKYNVCRQLIGRIKQNPNYRKTI